MEQILRTRRFFCDIDHIYMRLDLLRVLLEVSDGLGKPPAQVALRWVLSRPGVTSAIVGARDAGQLRTNIEADLWRLEGEPLRRLTEVSHLPDRYPEAMEKNMHERRDSAVRMPSLNPAEDHDA